MTRQNQNNKYYWIYGKHPVIAALNNPRRNNLELLLTYATLNDIKNEVDIKGFEVNYRTTELKELEIILGNKESNHQGIALKTRPLPGIEVNDLTKLVKDKKKSIIIALDQITDPHNLGAIMRSAAAFNVDGIIITKDNSAPETSIAAKAASGALDIVNIAYVTNLSQALEKMRKADFWIVGLDGGIDVQESIESVKRFDKIVLVIGSEGEGMRRLTRESCDLLVKIPIALQVESLNVSNAAAIAMYELKE